MRSKNERTITEYNIENGMPVKRKTKTIDSFADLYRMPEERSYTTTHQANSLFTEKKKYCILNCLRMTEETWLYSFEWIGFQFHCKRNPLDVRFQNTTFYLGSKQFIQTILLGRQGINSTKPKRQTKVIMKVEQSNLQTISPFTGVQNTITIVYKSPSQNYFSFFNCTIT